MAHSISFDLTHRQPWQPSSNRPIHGSKTTTYTPYHSTPRLQRLHPPPSTTSHPKRIKVQQTAVVNNGIKPKTPSRPAYFPPSLGRTISLHPERVRLYRSYIAAAKDGTENVSRTDVLPTSYCTMDSIRPWHF